MSYQTTGIIDILLAYGSRGGALYAAYRQLDNPLLLTDVRWQGQAGESLEAHRNQDDLTMPREEREAWTAVALRSSSRSPESVGPNAPWLQAPLDQREAYELATRAQRARAASAPPTPYSPVQSGGGWIADPASAFHANAPSRTPGHSPLSGGGAATPAGSGYMGSQSQGRGQVVDASHTHETYGGYAPLASDPSQTTGNWQREAFHISQTTIIPQQSPHEISVIVCAEIEMPALIGEVAQDFTRDFARDVAQNFNRAARTIPQTRETRGWMRGARMTLGALMVMGAGARPASRAEMDHAHDALASALAQRTLPYAQMRFADLAEWQGGIPLPD
jgi:hypothetical protein